MELNQKSDRYMMWKWNKPWPVWSEATTGCYCCESVPASTSVESSPGRSPAIGCGWVESRMNPSQRADVGLPSRLWSAGCWERCAAMSLKAPCKVRTSRLADERIWSWNQTSNNELNYFNLFPIFNIFQLFLFIATKFLKTACFLIHLLSNCSISILFYF